jgi:hypothetical protein
MTGRPGRPAKRELLGRRILARGAETPERPYLLRIDTDGFWYARVTSGRVIFDSRNMQALSHSREAAIHA